MTESGIEYIAREAAPENIVAYSVVGKVTLADYEEIMSRMRAVAKDHGEAKVLCIFPGYPGVEGGVIWQKLKDMSEIWQNLGSVAVIADQTVLDLLLKLADSLTPMHMKLFKVKETEEAWSWLIAEENS